MNSGAENYRGHAIEVRDVAAGDAELVVDGEVVAYGTLPDGRYYINENAYEWGTDLLDLARRYVDRRDPARG